MKIKSDNFPDNKSEFLELILNSSKEAIIATDIDGKIIYWNKGAEKLYKWKEKEVLGKNITQITPSETTKSQAEEIFKSLSEGNEWEGDFKVKNKNGKEFIARVTDSPIFDKNGKLVGIIGISRDNSERITTEKALFDNEEKYKALFDNIQEGVALHEIVFDQNKKPVDFIYLDCNPTYEKLTLLKKENIIGKRGLEVIPNLEQKWIDIYGKVALTGKPVNIIDHSDYLDKYWDVKAFSPKKNQFAVALTEVTEIIMMQKALKESEEKFRNIIEESPMGVLLYQLYEDNKLILTGSNNASGKILGINVSGLYGKTVEEAFPPLAKTEIPGIYREVAKNGIAWFTEQVNYSDDQNIQGAYEVYAFQSSPMNAVIMFLDISERRKNEEELKKHREHLEEMVEERTKELEEKIEEVERMNELFVGREFRIKELKDKIAALENRIKENP